MRGRKVLGTPEEAAFVNDFLVVSKQLVLKMALVSVAPFINVKELVRADHLRLFPSRRRELDVSVKRYV